MFPFIGRKQRDWRLKEGRQRIVVAVDDSHPGAEREGNGDVGFGDANVIADPGECFDLCYLELKRQALSNKFPVL